ncbi:MAG TPA: ATP-binding protein [Opitutaceae bacterium]|jgi:signal transduction histidine kinase|nr:ATP-binding protein [Opitutaceae bacterium]
MKFRDRPLRLKLGIALMSISVVMILLICGAFFVHDYVLLGRNTVRRVATLGQLVARNCTDALAFQDPDAARELLGALAGEPHIVEAALYDQSGRLFAKFPAALADAAFPSHPAAATFQVGASEIEGFQPVVQKGRPLGSLYLRFDRSAIFRQWFADSAGIALLVMLGALGVALACSRAVQNRICGPIATLADTARQVAERNDYSVRAVKTSNDEFGLLTDTFNQMLTQIERLNADLERRVRERTAQLETANRELEAFSYSVSHDLRAPLRHVDGFSAMLRKHAETTLDEKGKRLLNTISDSAKRMGQLIDDLLAFSRISRSQLSHSDVDHDALVAAVIREGRHDNPALEWSVAPLSPVRADPAMLRQVWSNLIANAVKYSGKNPRPRITIGERDEGGERVFFVRDNGVGFDMAYADKLFGVFQRLHGPSEFEGTGIGLANVRRIVTRHGGRTWAEGKVGEGAAFYFSLPKATPTPSSSYDTAPLQPAANIAG